jgi:hypothetical protein
LVPAGSTTALKAPHCTTWSDIDRVQEGRGWFKTSPTTGKLRTYDGRLNKSYCHYNPISKTYWEIAAFHDVFTGIALLTITNHSSATLGDVFVVLSSDDDGGSIMPCIVAAVDDQGAIFGHLGSASPDNGWKRIEKPCRC